ncbi:MAG: hypothetical protein IT318_20365 [Anaerolineales bacterium]|nr:hypothetical protein [Anaerolineales bacterium]
MTILSLPGQAVRQQQPDDGLTALPGALILPTWYVDVLRRRKAQIRAMAEQKRREADPAYQEERDRKLKDTKPVMYADTRDRHRPVLVVGGGGMWREDMKEKALRLLEKPNPARDPEMGMHGRNLREDVWTATDRRRRALRGARTFHIKNNPVSQKE